MSEPFYDLISILRERKENPCKNSYTNRLLAEGEDEIIKKIGEEAIEVILAAKGQGAERLLEELADLVYHISVLLVTRDLTWSDVNRVLAQRAAKKNLSTPIPSRVE